MVRRVKTYLSQVEIIDDEEKLREMSYLIEPPANNSTSALKPPIKSESLHSVSSVSSSGVQSDCGTASISTRASSVGPANQQQLRPSLTGAVAAAGKFGVHESDAMSKLMGLTERVRPASGSRATAAAIALELSAQPPPRRNAAGLIATYGPPRERLVGGAIPLNGGMSFARAPTSKPPVVNGSMQAAVAGIPESVTVSSKAALVASELQRLTLRASQESSLPNSGLYRSNIQIKIFFVVNLNMPLY